MMTASACYPWCHPDHCLPDVKHSSAPITVDTAEAEYHLRLVQWCYLDPDPEESRWDPEPRLSIHISHKTEIADAGAEVDQPLPLSLCAALTRREARALIKAQRELLRIAPGGAVWEE